MNEELGSQVSAACRNPKRKLSTQISDWAEQVKYTYLTGTNGWDGGRDDLGEKCCDNYKSEESVHLGVMIALAMLLVGDLGDKGRKSL